MSYELADGSLSRDYKIGDLFVYNDIRGDNYGTYSCGSIVKFLRNDGSSCPLFGLVEGECFSDTRESCDAKTSYASWEKLTRYSGTSVTKEQDPDVVIKQSDYDSLVDEINMLRELVAELTSVKEEQQFKPISEMTLEDWVRAKEECWEFEDRDGAVCEVECVTDGVVMFHNYAMGFNSNGTHIHYPEQYSIVKRIK